jgi:hypothetical protein
VVDDDLIFKFRLRLFSLAGELGNVREACWLMDVHPSTFYRWREQMLRSGSRCSARGSAGRPGCPTRRACSPSSACSRSPWVTPGSAPGGSAPPSPRSAGAASSSPPTGCGGSCAGTACPRRLSRLSLVAGYAAPPEPEGRPQEPPRHVEVDHPGELVGFDCFHVGRLAGTAGRVWQYTAIDLASSYVWAELATTPLNPSAAKTSALARRVAADLASHGWRLERVLTDIQRLRVPLPGVRGRRPRAGCHADLHPGRTTGDQRRRRAGPAHDPRGVLAAVVRPEPRA